MNQSLPARGKVVFICPVCPSFTGNGLSMRAAASLKLLSDFADSVHLIVVPFYTNVSAPEPEIADLCTNWQILAALPVEHHSEEHHAKEDSFTGEWNTFLSNIGLETTSEGSRYNHQWQARITDAIASIDPDLIFVFRFYTAQFVLPAFARKIPVWLDIDELESKSRSRFAHMNGRDSIRFENLMRESAAYRSLETRYLPLFQRIFAASDIEAKSVRLLSSGSDIKTLPNIYPRISPSSSPTQTTQTAEIAKTDDEFRILFVGTLGYQPNLDAIVYFCSDILPLIKNGTTRTVAVDVIGGGLSDYLAALSEANLLGRVLDCTPFYERCDLSIVPLRSGGGTRIKILESFSYKRPVVSTFLGAEGLSVENGVHLLLADGPEDFAAGCLSLIEDQAKRRELALKGHEFLLENHTLERLQSRVSELFGT